MSGKVFTPFTSTTRGRRAVMRRLRRGLVIFVLCFGAGQATAESYYLSGHISNVTFIGDSLYLMLDAGLPDNCTGTSYGWMVIPAPYKAMSAFVLGIWMRGTASSDLVTVYTDGIVNGFCQINQIDPVG